VTFSRFHRCDEFPAEYSLASCSPAELASAFSAIYHAATNYPVRLRNYSERLFGTFTTVSLVGGHLSLKDLAQIIPGDDFS
jgi:hypothetical protein